MITITEPYEALDTLTVYAVHVDMAATGEAPTFPVWRLIWIGACRLSQMATLADAMENSEFRNFTKAGMMMHIAEIARCADMREAHTMQIVLIDRDKPYCNLNGSTVSRRRQTGKVRCLDDGAEYDTARLAAKAAGCTPQTMSNHLNRRASYDRIAGRRYQRIGD